MPIFVVHKHESRNLHYDLRLKMEGVLKSWAVPKGPSMNPRDKRLALMVDDHDIAYADYEGVIPEGSYGAGPVMVWDRGTYEELKPGGLGAGKLEISLSGKKLKGKFALVKMKGSGFKGGGKGVGGEGEGEGEDNSWLLIKMKDEFAVVLDDILTRSPDSVKTGRSLKEIARDGPTAPPCEVME